MVMDNQGPGQDMPHGHSSLNNHLHPPPPIDPNPPPDTSILLQSNYMESPPTLAQNQTNQLPHAITDNETNQVPDAITDTTQANQISDTKTDTTPIQVIHAKTDTEPHQLPDFVTYTKLPDTKTDIKAILVPDTKTDTKIETQAKQLPDCKADIEADTVNSLSLNSKLNANPKSEPSSQANETKHEPATPKPNASSPDIASENVNGRELKPEVNKTELPTPTMNVNSNTRDSFLLDEDYEGSESGTEEEQSAFMKELENLFRENGMEFKPPKFYGEGLNCLKLWRAVTRLGGYDKVTSCKLWRQVGEAFKPPKTCTTVSWTFRGFYEKALLDYERHKTSGGDLSHLTLTVASQPEPTNIHNQASGSGRARRDAAARAMQGWHSQRVLGNGEVGDPIIKDKNSLSLQKREKQLKSLGLLKRKKSPYMEHAIVKAQRTKPSNPQLDVAVVDIGQPADWVKINVQRNKDCFEVYALVPGLLREEVRVQSDPAGRLVISGAPENPDNPWGVTPFKKVVTLPARIDPHQTSAVVTLHGQLFVRVPFEASE